MQVTPDELRSRLAAHADDVEVVGERYRDDHRAVYDVRLDDRRAVCKLTSGTGGDPRAVNPPRVEAAVCRAVRATGAVRAPPVVAVDDECLVLGALAGDRYDPEAPVEARDRRIRAAGAALARLHRATADWFDACGDLAVGGAGATGAGADAVGSEGDRRGSGSDAPPGLAVADPKPWAERFPSRVGDWLTGLEGTDHAALGVELRAATRRARERGLLGGVAPALVHAGPDLLDLRLGDGAGGAPDLDPTVGLADWSAASPAPPEFDLAYARFEWFDLPTPGEDPGFRDALLAGYRSVRTPARGSPDRRRLYRAALAAWNLPSLVAAAESGPLDADPDEIAASLDSYARDCLDAAGLREES